MAAGGVYDPENEGDQQYHPRDSESTGSKSADSRPDSPDELRRAETSAGKKTTRVSTSGGSGSTIRFNATGGTSGSTMGSGGGSGTSFNFNPSGDRGSGTSTNGGEDGSGSGSDFNFNSDGDKKGGVAAGGLATAELAAGLSNPASFARGAKNFFWGSKNRKRATVGGGVTGGMVAGGFFILAILSGPGQLIHLSEILQKNFTGMDNATSYRTNLILGSAGAQDIGETRLSIIQRQYLRSAVDKLGNIGIEFETNSVGQLRGATIDTNKLADKYPELDGMSQNDRQAWLVDHYKGVYSPSQFVSDGNGKFKIDASDFPSKSLRLLSNRTYDLAGNGTAMAAFNKRILAKYFDIQNLFHPIQKSLSDKSRGVVNGIDDKTRAVQEEQAKMDEKVQAPGEAAFSDAKGKANDYTSAASNLLLFTGGVCLVRSIAGDIVTINRSLIVLPTAVQASNFIAIGEQAKAGQDITLDQLGPIEQSLTDSNGQTIWSAKALQATAGNPNPTGQDIPSSYKAAYSPDVTANAIKGWADDAIGGSFIAGLACSPGGIAAQFLGSVALSAASVISEIGTAGADTPAVVGLWAGKEGLSFTLSAVGLHIVQQFILSKTTTGALAKDAFSGPLGGNLLAYGARAASNIGAIAEGGIQLSNSTAAALAYQQQQQNDKQFHSESFFARTFDVNDYRSLAGKLADSVSPHYTQNVASVATGFGSIGSSLLSNFSSIFIPKSHAAGSGYDFGSPLYGIPPDLLQDPQLASPSDNANKVAAYLDNGDSKNFKNKVHVCFGDTISKDSGVWDVSHDEDPNPSDQTYIDANCDNLTDPDWRRVIMFVFDTSTAQAMACSLGDDQSCNTIGFGGASGSTQNPTPTSGASGGLTNPFPDGWIPNRLDMGYDGTFKNKIVAPFSGTITYASTSFSNWGGWIELKADNQPAGLPSSTLYFAEGVKPTVTNGQHVNAGDQIAVPAPSPYGNAYGTNADGSGEIEWGLAQDGSVGTPTNTYVYGQCGSSSATSTVMAFSQWAQQNLGLSPPSQTSNAGCP